MSCSELGGFSALMTVFGKAITEEDIDFHRRSTCLEKSIDDANLVMMSASRRKVKVLMRPIPAFPSCSIAVVSSEVVSFLIALTWH